MSFYSMFFGKNPNTDIILALVGLKEVDVERYRDCWIDFDDKEIGIYTRTGGGNREGYPQEILYASPYFKTTYDDDYDCTYATFVFRFPEEIEKEIFALQDIVNNGIPAKLMQWLAKTLNREETEKDKWKENYNKQARIIADLQQNGHCSEAFNGHTIVPLSDQGMRKILMVMEEADGKLLPYWYVLPLKLEVKLNVPRWEMDAKKPDLEQEKHRVLITLPDKWPIDHKVWERWKKKFGEKYPKAVANINKKVNKSKKEEVENV